MEWTESKTAIPEKKSNINNEITIMCFFIYTCTARHRKFVFIFREGEEGLFFLEGICEIKKFGCISERCWVIPRCGHYIQIQKFEFEAFDKPLPSLLRCSNLCVELLKLLLTLSKKEKLICSKCL